MSKTFFVLQTGNKTFTTNLDNNSQRAKRGFKRWHWYSSLGRFSPRCSTLKRAFKAFHNDVKKKKIKLEI